MPLNETIGKKQTKLITLDNFFGNYLTESIWDFNNFFSVSIFKSNIVGVVNIKSNIKTKHNYYAHACT